MTTDLKSMTVKELRASMSAHGDHWKSRDAIFLELARRLEEEQQKIAEAKAEALEWAALAYPGNGEPIYGWLKEKAAEYRAKAGRKE